MSPRRMDISSLLCNDLTNDSDDANTLSTAQSDSPRYTDRPRSIDALIHPSTASVPPSSSLLSILNNTDPNVSPSNNTRRLSRPSPLTHSSPPSSPSTILYLPTSSHSYSPTEHRHTQGHPYVHPMTSPSAQSTQRSPFLGLDALVHVASEERRRISTASTTSPTTARSERDTESEKHRDRRFEQDTNAHTRVPVALVHDHERHSWHHSHPLKLGSPATQSYQRFVDHSPPLEDNARPHKRIRDGYPPSPLDTQLAPAGPQVASHSSASTLNDYATMRRQPALYMDATRSAPGLLVGPASDLRVSDSQLTESSVLPSSPSALSPFFQPHHLLHTSSPTLQSPRNRSPHRHSPQQLRFHHSPTQGSLSPSLAVETMSRFGHGPRMAGGISVLTNDLPPVRDVPRPGSSSFEGIKREASRERFMYEIPGEHAQVPLQAPVPKLAVSLRGGVPHAIREAQIFPAKVESMDGVIREQTQMRYQQLPVHSSMPVRPLSHPLPEHHPLRVWEEEPEGAQRISSPPTASQPVFHLLSDLENQSENERVPSEISNDGMRDENSIAEDAALALHQAVGGNVPTPSFHTRGESPLPLALQEASVPPKDSVSWSQPPSGKAPIDPKSIPLIPVSIHPVRSVPQDHLSDVSPPKVSSPHSPHIDALATTGIDLHVGPQTRPDSVPSEPQVSPGTLVSSQSSAQIASEFLSSEVNSIVEEPTLDLSTATVAFTRLEALEHSQLTPVHDPQVSKIPEQSPESELTHGKTRSSSRQPHSLLVFVKEEGNVLLEGIPTSITTQPGPSPCQSPRLVSEHEPLAPEPSMMDVDEELLSLVEGAPVRAMDGISKTEMKSSFAPMGQGTGALGEVPGSSPLPSSHSVIKPHLTMGDDKDRASMPPPAPRAKKAEKDKGTTGTSTGGKKKKDPTSKAPARPKQPPKPRAKPAPKTKSKSTVADVLSRSAVVKGGSNTNVRSRSMSVLPGAAEDPAPEPEAEGSEKEDDKLYCICKTHYDEDRMMIACDRCDEWFHTQCIKMPDLEIDLVDQFICPPCIQRNQHLRTTWKRRCLFGLKHENPSSPEACHKPSRGPFSKYCSDECGIKYMQAHMAQWENSGGTRDQLWESVKNATKREGVVVRVDVSSPSKMDVDGGNSQSKQEPLDAAAKRGVEREVARLNARLEEVVKEREFMKRDLDMVLWREKVVDLASERAAKVDECGWDQRLCFGEEEWADFGAEVLESYEEGRTKLEAGDDAMPLDGAAASDGEWWCTGKKKCERHTGWQKLRIAEVSFDKETKEGILLGLTTQEREIRKRIEDMLCPQSNNPSNLLHPELQLNGSGKPRSELGKKKSS